MSVPAHSGLHTRAGSTKPLTTTFVKAKALYELGKPNLSFLVVVTAVIGFLLALSSQTAAGQGLWFRALMLVVGTALTAMGACAANMCREAQVDIHMKRTRTRPLPSGRVSEPEAIAYVIFIYVLGFALLYFGAGAIPAWLSLATFVTYVFIYTPAKLKGPISIWIGAIPGAMPPLMGWATVTGSLDAEAFALFALMFTWQFPHFLALAYMYREDYERGGFRFLPRENVEYTTGAHIGVGALVVVLVSFVPSVIGLVGSIYLVMSLIAGLYFLRAGFRALSGLTNHTARDAFFASIIYLPVLLVAIVLDRAVALAS